MASDTKEKPASKEVLLNVKHAPHKLRIYIKYNRETDKYVKLIFDYCVDEYNYRTSVDMLPEEAEKIALTMIKLKDNDYPSGFSVKDPMSGDIVMSSDGDYETLLLLMGGIEVYGLYTAQSAYVDGEHVVDHTYFVRNGFKIISWHGGVLSEMNVWSHREAIPMFNDLGFILLKEIA